MNTPTTKEKLVSVTLLKDGHTHNGKSCAKDDKIDVTPAEAKWLTNPKRGIAAYTKAGSAGGNEA